MTEFINGIITGVVASIVFSGLVVFVKFIVLPWIQSILYDGPNLNGDWQLFYSTDSTSKSVGRLKLKHFGQNLSGNVNIWRNRTGEEVDRKMKFHGSFRGGQVLAFYEDEKLKGFIVGVVLLRISKNNEFAGKSMYCHPTQNSVEAYDLCLRK